MFIEVGEWVDIIIFIFERDGNFGSKGDEKRAKKYRRPYINTATGQDDTYRSCLTPLVPL